VGAQEMKMAFICFDQMTSLDLTGFSTAVTWIGILNVKENVSWDFVPFRLRLPMIAGW
jgi:hypothetical protein